MIDVCLLGTGGMMPLPYRYLTSLMLRYNGKGILVDCGEGTQVALRKKGWSPKPVDVILFTHYHADHISGLPGMLLTMGNAERTEPVLMAGPKGLSRIVNSLRVIAPELPFEIQFLELSEREQTFDLPGEKDFHIHAFRVSHNVPCYGFAFELDRAGRFDAARAQAQGIPLKLWSRLQKGETIETEEGTYTPDMVLGPPRKGLKLVYSTDTRPCESIVKYASGADLLICEGMYGEPDKAEKAREHKHMTFTEAARIARKAAPKQMWLTHYSPSLIRPEEYMDPVRSIFPESIAARDGRTTTLAFEEK
ncbi:MAG: ribonuclease Z [Lachnospiraceae bacterium]|uniref:ribonuclease Z n=1 Tax=Sarcina sp. DSM 11001 TaxID=1798184 RepID=UPI00088BF207|nr:ribonuclease Z [Sarcina sp. DSM 11001]MDO5485377.1 ribonuclease Z [Sarcina sp.]MEE1040356.1 ribonuclease Z [Lachnospiraceae bacterium]SDL33843.1 RNAse Z [Sarcina sp. DSM 11001]HAL58061.1 ribonuclease Z [Sarcina sp.]